MRLRPKKEFMTFGNVILALVGKFNLDQRKGGKVLVQIYGEEGPSKEEISRILTSSLFVSLSCMPFYFEIYHEQYLFN